MDHLRVAGTWLTTASKALRINLDLLRKSGEAFHLAETSGQTRREVALKLGGGMSTLTRANV